MIHLFNKNLRNNAPSRKGANIDEKDFFMFLSSPTNISNFILTSE